ncbi:MAG: hypothetical protein M1821_003789 [Bathelium mastoideum]|nr:MAG: hypothetical protein M1821_003789 [Bathelium mastoideum]
MTFEDDVQSLRAIPWCRKLIDDPDTILTPLASRIYKADHEDALFSKTFNTKDTIKSAIWFYKKAAPGQEYVEELHSLMTVGNLIDGQSKIAHGGVVATILDEIIGLLFEVNKDLGKGPGRGYSVTACLNVSYTRPVFTPTTILITARLRKVDGRKRFADGEIKDGEGNVLAKAESLFLAPKQVKL